MATPGGLRTHVRALQIKVEGTKGTAEDTALIEELVYDPIMRPTAEFTPRAGSGKKLGNTNPGGVFGLQSGECTFTMEFRSTGSAALTTGLAAAMTGCGLLNTAETYTPESDLASQQTCTIFQFVDGEKKALAGAMGNVEIYNDGANRRVLCDFSFIGRWVAPDDVAVPTINHSTTMPMKFGTADGSFTMGNTPLAINISQFRFNTGNELFLRPGPAAAGGIVHTMIGQRNPTLTIDPEAQLVANRALYALWLAGTEEAVSLVVSDGVDKATLAIPNFQYVDVAPGDREGLAIDEITGQCNNAVLGTGDDEYSLAIAVK